MTITFWEARSKDWVHTRFICAECLYDSMVRTRDRMTLRFDCLFCGWECFFDIHGWWHLKTTGEWMEENEEERRTYPVEEADFIWSNYQ